MHIQIPPFLSEQLEHSVFHGPVVSALHVFGELIKDNRAFFFPDYTDHGVKHISDVMMTAESLITPASAQLFTSDDAAALILAILLHDVAMHIQPDGFLALIRGGEWNQGVAPFDVNGWPQLWERFRGRASRFGERELQEVFGVNKPIPMPDLDQPGEWSDNQRRLIGEFIRAHHSRLAHQIALHGVPGVAAAARIEIAGIDPIRDMIGIIARSHGLPLRSCLRYVETHLHLRTFKNVHPIYLMVLLRISDYLQIQSSRASSVRLQVQGLRSPLSVKEWHTHLAVANISNQENDPEAINIQVDAAAINLETVFRLQSWCVGLQQELDVSWAVLGEVFGRYGTAAGAPFGICLRRVKSDLDDLDQFAKRIPFVPCRAALCVAECDLLQSLVRPLYGNKPEVGVRELVQNAVDAVRELRFYLSQPQMRGTSVRVTEQEGDVVVQVYRLANEKWSIIVTDKGIGMTVDTILHYFLKAGASYRNSGEWRERFAAGTGQPQVLRAGRFGIGVLATFLLGEEIHVRTRHVNDDSGCEFAVRLDTNSVTLHRVQCPVGTRIEVISRNPFAFLLRDVNPYVWSSQDNWDWYCLSDPSVRRIDAEGRVLLQTYTVPSELEVLPPDWNRINPPHYSAVQWSYSKAPPLSCNGLVVPYPPMGDLWYDHVLGLRLRRPNTMVIDPDARLSLSLDRMRVEGDRLDFLGLLKEDVERDIVAFIAVTTPSSLDSWATSVDGWPTYPGFAADENHEWSRWLVLRNGLLPAVRSCLAWFRCTKVLVVEGKAVARVAKVYPGPVLPYYGKVSVPALVEAIEAPAEGPRAIRSLSDGIRPKAVTLIPAKLRRGSRTTLKKEGMSPGSMEAIAMFGGSVNAAAADWTLVQHQLNEAGCEAAVEVELEHSRQPRDSCFFDRLWRERIGRYVVPFDVQLRRRRLEHVFNNPAYTSHIVAWEHRRLMKESGHVAGHRVDPSVGPGGE